MTTICDYTREISEDRGLTWEHDLSFKAAVTAEEQAAWLKGARDLDGKPYDHEKQHYDEIDGVLVRTRFSFIKCDN